MVLMLLLQFLFPLYNFIFIIYIVKRTDIHICILSRYIRNKLYYYIYCYSASRNRHIIVALHRWIIVTRTDNCTALFKYFFKMHSDIVIDNRHCIVIIHRHTIVTGQT